MIDNLLIKLLFWIKVYSFGIKVFFKFESLSMKIGFGILLRGVLGGLLGGVLSGVGWLLEE